MTPSCVSAGLVIVGESRHVRASRPSTAQRLGQSEVQHLHGAVGAELDVGGLQVAMHDALLVRGLERVGDLPGDRQGFVDGQRPAGNAVRERRTLNEFEHERGHAVALFETVDRRDVRVVQRGKHLGLALEAHQAVGIDRKRGGRPLDRDVAVQAVSCAR